jgi:signal transduction histidine kinase
MHVNALHHAMELMAYMVDYVITGQTSRTITLGLEPVDLQAGMRRLCDYYLGPAQRKHITLVPRLVVDVLPVATDRVVLAVILDNFLSNAVKYSSPGGRIFMDLSEDLGGVVCSVTDEGPGLSADDQARVFQRGVTLTPRPTAGERSTGFGLAIAKELAEQLGATVGCDSELGRGSRFWVKLPLVPNLGSTWTSRCLLPVTLASHVLYMLQEMLM